MSSAGDWLHGRGRAAQICREGLAKFAAKIPENYFLRLRCPRFLRIRRNSSSSTMGLTRLRVRPNFRLISRSASLPLGRSLARSA